MSSTTSVPTPAPIPGAPALQLPHLPWVPTGANPATYDIDRVHTLMKSAAYFTLFNGPNATVQNQANLLIPGLPLFISSVDVNEMLHRYEMEAGWAGNEFRAARRLGEAVGTVGIHWMPIPDYFVASPDCDPPAWVFNPTISQRYCMLKGQMNFHDIEKSGAHNFGCGHTFPVIEGGKRRMRVGAVIDILVGRGKWAGIKGLITINGYIEPPKDLALCMMIRLMDPTGKFQTDAPMPALQPIADPDPDAVTVMVLGEVDPDGGVQVIPTADGKGMSGSHVKELLRLVRIESDVTSPNGMCTRLVEGPILGRLEARLYFNAFDTARVTPIQTRNGYFEFWDRKGNTIGKVFANMVEGRAFKTEVEGFDPHMPIYRFGGLGPVLGGTGQFEGADGMMTMNACITTFPRTLSNMYYFRFYDPQGKIRRAWDQLNASW